jgi:hypothetical protein
LRSLASLQHGTAADADSLSISKGDIMDAGATPDLVDQLLTKTFAELGATGSVVRTFLLHDRQFVGQKFRCDGFQALMLAGKGEIEFYDEGGVLLKTVSLEETEKKAAA